MNKVALRANITMLIALLLLGGFVFFLVEYAVSADDWVVFAGSPHVYNGGNIGTGVVTDRDGYLLLDMNDGRTYSSSEALRKSTVHWVGDHKGSVDAPALSNYSAEMTGYDLVSGVYVYGEAGGVAGLTLSAAAQEAALKALGNKKGTVGVYNYETGELLCAVSTPTFDPDNVPEVTEDLEGMYLNRFTQSVYIPGSIFKVVTLAAALETMPEIQDQKFSCDGTYKIGNDKITCEYAHGDQSLKKAFRNSCNCAFAQIAQQLGGDTLERYAQQFGVVGSLEFDGITTASGNFEAAGAAEVNVAWSGIGQYNDQVNACNFMTFMGAIARGGRGVAPYLVDSIRVGSSTTYRARTHNNDRIMSESTAELLREYLMFNVEDKYGAENFKGMTVGAKTGTGEVGGGKKPNAVLAGFVEDEQTPLAFIVIVEDGGYGADVCIPIISKVLTVCKDVMN